MRRPHYFWFIAQTGAFYFTEEAPLSNFYAYCIPRAKLGLVQLAAEDAEIGETGCREYPQSFLGWLQAHDDERQRRNTPQRYEK